MRSISPHDDEEEQATHGSVLMRHEVLDRIADLITPGDCLRPLERAGAVGGGWGRSVPGRLQRRGGFANNGAYYANIMRKKSMNRQFYSPLGVAR